MSSAPRRRFLAFVLSVAFVVCLLGAYVYGVLAHKNAWPPQPQLSALYWRFNERPADPAQAEETWDFSAGRRLHQVPQTRRGAGKSQEDERLAKEFARLRALGYAGGSRVAPPPSDVGVGRYDTAAAYNGINLITDGHDTWAALMDMHGKVLHSWSHSFKAAFPKSDAVETEETAGTLGNFRRVALLPGGELLAIFEGWGLIKLDKSSKLLWAYDGKAHHALAPQPDGRIFVLTRVVEVVPRINKELPILHDYVTVLDANGKLLEQVSILEALERSPYSPLLEISEKQGDIFHSNAIEVLDGRLADRLPAFKEGNVLVSLREVNAVVVLDMAQKKVVWAMAGLSKQQHEPSILDNGHMILFDNIGLGEDKSRVIEIDLVGQQIVWTYQHDDFFSRYCGIVQRLPNGNTLITESDPGRAFEVQPDGNIVWEYRSPHRFGKNREFIASVFEVARLPPDYPLDWLPPAKN